MAEGVEDIKVNVGVGFIQNHRIGHVVQVDEDKGLCLVEFQVHNCPKRLMYYEEYYIDYVQKLIHASRYGGDIA